MRTLFALALLLAAPAALAQSPSDADARAAAEAALLSADAALADSMEAVMPEVFAAMGEAMVGMIAAMDSAFAGMGLEGLGPADLELSEEDLAELQAMGVSVEGGEAPEASGDDGYDALALYRRPVRAAARAYPAVAALYGSEADGFPAQATIEGTVVSAGSLRLCRQGREPVSRWLRVRLKGTTPEMPAHMIVAVECDERAARHYVGRTVRMRAWKSEDGRPVRMAHDDVPASDAPLYVTYPGDLTVR